MLRFNGDKCLRLPAGLMFVLGPFMGLLFVCLIPLVSLIATLMLIPRMALASGALSSDEAQMCLGCHSSPGMVKVFRNNEKLSVHISEKDFKDTVHGFLTCTGCHSTISMDSHPGASKYGSRKELASTVSASCRACHAEEQIFAKPVHRQAIKKANAPPCSDCHGVHSIQRISALKTKATDSQHCLTCHKQQLSISAKGETLTLSIDESSLRKSVHSNHRCSDCHTAYSKKEHPVMEFTSSRARTIALSSACRRCHAAKYAQFEGSIHYAMLKEGNLKAPICVDCHSAHSVGRRDITLTMNGVPCKKCHEEIFGIYRESVHGTAKADGSVKAPICSSCHFAHDVKAVSMTGGKTREACLGCHEKALEAHRKWLPNADTHLEAVACAACHVLEAKKSIYLVVSERNTGKDIAGPRIENLLGQCETSENCIDEKEMWNIYRKLGKDVVFTGKVNLGDGKKAHQLRLKSKALRDCDKCHSANSDFFRTVKMTVIKADGRAQFYNVNPKVLSSALSVLPLNQFYALGSTRVKLLDLLGVLAVLGGASFPAIHILARILTRPIRAKHKGVKK